MSEKKSTVGEKRQLLVGVEVRSGVYMIQIPLSNYSWLSVERQFALVRF